MDHLSRASLGKTIVVKENCLGRPGWDKLVIGPRCRPLSASLVFRAASGRMPRVCSRFNRTNMQQCVAATVALFLFQTIPSLVAHPVAYAVMCCVQCAQKT